MDGAQSIDRETQNQPDIGKRSESVRILVKSRINEILGLEKKDSGDKPKNSQSVWPILWRVALIAGTIAAGIYQRMQ